MTFKHCYFAERLPFLLCAWLVLSGCTDRKRPAVELPAAIADTCRIRLVLAGDLMQHQPQVYAARDGKGGYDYTESFRYVAPIFREADLAILNLETTLMPSGRYTGYPRFRSPARLADLLQDIGIDVALLANNHICDNGRAGMNFTIACLDSAGIASTGAFADSLQYGRRHPLRIEVDGMRLAILNYTYDTNGMPVPSGAVVNLTDTSVIARDIERIDRTETDCVMVFFHWGEEYVRRPDAEQRRLAAFCRQRGVELVVGSHPHVVQPVEIHADSTGLIRAVTLYSLGNLVSNQRKRYCDGGLLVTLELEKIDSRPLQITLCYTPVWVSLPAYRILPPSVADTFPLSDKEQELYRQFRQDIRKLFADESNNCPEFTRCISD